MLFAKIDELGNPVEVPISLGTLYKRNPNVMFPSELTNETLLPLGFVCIPTEATPARKEGRATTLGVPVKNEDGTYSRTYVYIPYTEEGLATRVEELRAKRDTLLSDSDWMVSDDVRSLLTETQKLECDSYRNDLRSITDKYSDPNLAVFPTAPDLGSLGVVKTAADIVYERISAKRKDIQAAGLVYQFPDGQGTIQTRDSTDMQNINGQVTTALILQSSAPETVMTFKDAENVEHSMLPDEVIAMGLAAVNFVSNTYKVKWVKDAEVAAMVIAGATDAEILAYDVGSGW